MGEDVPHRGMRGDEKKPGGEKKHLCLGRCRRGLSQKELAKIKFATL